MQIVIADVPILIRADSSTNKILLHNYLSLVQTNENELQPVLVYETSVSGNNQYKIQSQNNEILIAVTTSDFIYKFEKNLTINLQKTKPDLFFVHSAALSYGPECILLIGKSGAGKSTTTWALTHHGFSYLSDELSPIDPHTMQIWPYPHALCLKNTPPTPYNLPAETLHTERTLHIPTQFLSGGITQYPCKVTKIFFIKYDPAEKHVHLESLSSANATINLYINALNQLAHENNGLPAAAHIASHCQCFELRFSDVYQACLSIRRIVAG